MARLFPFQEADYPELLDWLGTLRNVAGNAQVFGALLDHSKLSPDEAQMVIRVGTSPFLFVEDIAAYGHFSPARPDTISFAKHLALDLRARPTDAQVRRLVEATVLHEIVHWSWARAGKAEVDATGHGLEKGREFEQAAYANAVVVEAPRALARGNENLGELSREYESNGNPGAVGRDSTGGWSYGLYQLASKLGRVQEFLNYLQRESRRTPEYANILQELLRAGGDPDAQRGTPVFRAAWRRLGANPHFANAQHDYIKTSHYDPFVAALRPKGIDVDQRTRALREVAWSVSVQHGPSSIKLFTQPFATLPITARNDDARFISAIYFERSKVDLYFRRSTEAVRRGVLLRFQKELAKALRMLQQT